MLTNRPISATVWYEENTNLVVRNILSYGENHLPI